MQEAVWCGVVWCRYSSYGRHFTKLHLLEQVAQLLSFYLHDGDTVVDFSCGANAFVPLVKQEGRKQGLSLKGKAYDIITSQNMEDFERASWLDTCPGQQPNNLSSPGIARGCFGKAALCCVRTGCAWATHDVRQPLAIYVSCRSCQVDARLIWHKPD